MAFEAVDLRLCDIPVLPDVDELIGNLALIQSHGRWQSVPGAAMHITSIVVTAILVYDSSRIGPLERVPCWDDPRAVTKQHGLACLSACSTPP